MRLRGFERLSNYGEQEIVLPARKTKFSAGYDIAASQEVVIPAGSLGLVPTGLKAYMPADEFLSVHIRSGLSVKHCLSLINSQGIIDSDYYNNPENEGHIMIALYNHGKSDVLITKGMRIAQGIFQKYYTTDNDPSDISVRSGGFGSTGF